MPSRFWGLFYFDGTLAEHGTCSRAQHKPQRKHRIVDVARSMRSFLDLNQSVFSCRATVSL